jgi:hypothetical protein
MNSNNPDLTKKTDSSINAPSKLFKPIIITQDLIKKSESNISSNITAMPNCHQFTMKKIFHYFIINIHWVHLPKFHQFIILKCKLQNLMISQTSLVAVAIRQDA